MTFQFTACRNAKRSMMLMCLLLKMWYRKKTCLERARKKKKTKKKTEMEVHEKGKNKSVECLKKV